MRNNNKAREQHHRSQDCSSWTCWLPFPVDQTDTCKDQGIPCPMTAGKTYTFKTVLPIKSLYPNVQVIVKWEMYDQDDKMVSCWEVAAQIVSEEGLNSTPKSINLL